jgi:Calcipressin
MINAENQKVSKNIKENNRFFSLSLSFHLPLFLANARIQLHQYKINKSIINCYFAQPVTPISNKNLQPPAPTKQFLISPPSSPPAGWAQAEESEPNIICHDLLAALASLNPGEVHEIHAASENQPGILVHTAIVGGVEEETAETAATADGSEEAERKLRMGVVHTRCPERT